MHPFKKKIERCLQEKKYDELFTLSPSIKKVLSALISLSYDKKNIISWRAIEAIGFLTKKTAGSNPELVRNIVGRLLWMLRDESGGIGWSVPEILGEIVKNNPELCSDIASVIASFHNEEMLRAGVLWAIGRIGKTKNGFADYAVPIVLPYLQSTEKTLRGYASWALGELGVSETINNLEKLKNDNNLITIYEEGELKEIQVGETARKAIAKLIKAG